MRFTIYLLCVLLLLTAGNALAREKTPDMMDFAARASAAFNPPESGSLTVMSSTYDRIYNLGAVDAQCGAEAIDSENDGMYYDLYCLQVDDTNPIELVLDAGGTNIADTVLTLYCALFDPLNPELNVVAFDDDSGEATLSALTAAHDIRLDPGQEYWLVISTYGADMTGNYLLQKSSNVYDCGAVANDRASWGSIKGMYR